MRYQFRLPHLFVLITIIAFATALIVQRQYHARLEAQHAAELAKAHRLLRDNRLDWQLDDLPKDHVRIVVEDFYGDGPIKTSLPDLQLRQLTLRTIGPAKVYLVPPHPQAKMLLLEADAVEDEAATARIPILAHRYENGFEDLATFRLFLPGRGEMQTIKADQQMKDLFALELVSGDYKRGQPIDLYTRGTEGRAKWQLLVE